MTTSGRTAAAIHSRIRLRRVTHSTSRTVRNIHFPSPNAGCKLTKLFAAVFDYIFIDEPRRIANGDFTVRSLMKSLEPPRHHPSLEGLEQHPWGYKLCAMAQQLLFESGDVRITSSIAQFGGTSYQIANIGSVRAGMYKTRRPIVIMIFILGLVFLIAAFADRTLELAAAGLAFRSAELALSSVAIMVGAGLFQLICPRRNYTLILKTSSGDVQAFTSRKKELVVKVKQAVEQAFIASRANT